MVNVPRSEKSHTKRVFKKMGGSFRARRAPRNIDINFLLPVSLHVNVSFFVFADGSHEYKMQEAFGLRYS